MKIGPSVAALAALLAAAAASAAFAQTRPELALGRIVFAKSGHELSGLAVAPHGLWTVADAAEDHFIYRIDLGKKGERFKVKPEIDLTKLKGYAAYAEELQGALGVPAADRRLDLEGVATCGDEVYLINERVRQVLLVDLKHRTLNKAPIDFAAVPELAALLVKGESNAGFEGIAADCAGQKIYLAKERDPRRLIVVDRKTWAVEGDFDLPASDRAGQQVINPFTGQGLFAIGPDFADLTFEGGMLYVLERNTFEVAKVEPKTMQVVARVSYMKTETGLYQTGEPFGIAEGLTLTPDTVIVAFDNNHSPLSTVAAKTYGAKGDGGAVAVFARPAGF